MCYITRISLCQVPGIEGVMDPGAIQFCARKISVITGDIRKALDICRRAIELVEMKGQEGGKVTIPYISKVVQEVYEDEAKPKQKARITIR